MRYWRIAKSSHALDRSSAATTRYGGRWNPGGTPAFYASTSLGLCALETFVHVAASRLPMVVVAVDVPDTASTYEPNIDSLPERWDEVPVSSAAQAFGRRWLDEARQLCLKIPSVIVPEEKNVVINPRHPEYPNVQLTVIRPFSFDPRMHK